MFAMTRKKLKIFNFVVGKITINMMNDFCRFQNSSKVLFHYKAVIRNITIIIAWVSRFVNKNVTSMLNKTTFPVYTMFRTIFSSASFFPSSLYKKFFSTFKTVGFNFICISFSHTFARTISFSIARIIKKFFTTNSADEFGFITHTYLQIKKPAFRSLTDSRLSVSTLLTGLFKQKKFVNPLDNLSIPYFGVKSR